MKKTILLITGIVLVSLACSNLNFAAAPTDTPVPPATFTSIPATETATPTIAVSSTPEMVDYGPTNFPDGVNPLTGLKVGDPTLLERRPVSVKIQIFPREERPPFSLSLADVVYDYYQNNGLTRFNAIFYGNDAEQVGPVRSARLMDNDILEMYKADFAFGSADKKILKVLLNAPYSNRLVFEGALNCPPMCRVDPNGANYLVANTKEIATYLAGKGVDNARQNLDGMKFQLQAPPNGVPGMQMFARYSISSYNRWDYDQASGRYLRFQDTQEDAGQGEGYAPLMDRTTNTQIAADNVVVIFATHEYAYKSGNSEVIDIRLTGNGVAIALRDGQAYKLRWERTGEDSIFALVFPDGTPYSYKPGVTYYQVMGNASTVENNDSGVWRFVLKFP